MTISASGDTAGLHTAAASAAPLVVRARLIEATPIPELEEIAPYDSALVVHTYRVLDVLSGDLSDREVSVAHWAIRKRKTLDIPSATNATVRLELVPYHLCPELRGEKVADTTPGFDLLFFFAMNCRVLVESMPRPHTGHAEHSPE